MKTIRKIFPVIDNGQRENVIEARFYYNLGGTDWASGRPKPRGYYIDLLPVRMTSENGLTRREFTPFGGGGWTLLAEVPRQSKARERAALNECQRRLPELMSIVLGNTGLALEPGIALSMI